MTTTVLIAIKLLSPGHQRWLRPWGKRGPGLAALARQCGDIPLHGGPGPIISLNPTPEWEAPTAEAPFSGFLPQGLSPQAIPSGVAVRLSDFERSRTTSVAACPRRSGAGETGSPIRVPPSQQRGSDQGLEGLQIGERTPLHALLRRRRVGFRPSPEEHLEDALVRVPRENATTAVLYVDRSPRYTASCRVMSRRRRSIVPCHCDPIHVDRVASKHQNQAWTLRYQSHQYQHRH